jgi:hypothetical protein
MDQVDVAWGWGPIGRHRPAPQGNRSAPPVALPHQWSMGSPPQPMRSLHSSRFNQGPRLAHDGLMGPLSYTWELPLTYQLTFCPNLHMCYLHNHLGVATSTLDAKAVHPRASWRPPVATDLATAYKYSPCLPTLQNRGCGARWKVTPFKSHSRAKHTKLLLAL